MDDSTASWVSIGIILMVVMFASIFVYQEIFVLPQKFQTMNEFCLQNGYDKAQWKSDEGYACYREGIDERGYVVKERVPVELYNGTPHFVKESGGA